MFSYSYWCFWISVFCYIMKTLKYLTVNCENVLRIFLIFIVIKIQLLLLKFWLTAIIPLSCTVAYARASPQTCWHVKIPQNDFRVEHKRTFQNTKKHLLEIKEIYMLWVLINDCHISLGKEYCLDHLLMLNHHLISYFLFGMYNFRGLYKTYKCRVIIHLKFVMFDCIETLIFFICCWW